MLEAAATNCTAEAQVNGVPVCRSGPDSALLDCRPVNHFVVAGENTFTLVVEQGPTPRTALTPSAIDRKSKQKLKARLCLRSVPGGAFANDPRARELLRIAWDQAPLQPYRPPVVLSEKIGLPGTAEAWSWLQGDNMRSDAILQNITGMLRDLRESLVNGDPEPFIRRSTIRFNEAAAAFGMDVEEHKQAFREQLRRIAAEPGFEMQPLNAETMDLRICAGGKLVDCVDRTWEPLLRTLKLASGATRLRYPAKVASIGGELQIVR